jgi:hypothetical protein
MRKTPGALKDVCDRKNDRFVRIECPGYACLREDPYYPAARVADAQPFAERVACSEKLCGHDAAEHADGRLHVHIHRRQKQAALHAPVLNLEHRCGRAEDRGVALARSPRCSSAADHDRRYSADVRTTPQCDDVLQRQVALGFADQHPLKAGAGRVGPAGEHDQQIRAERGELAGDVATRAFADRSQHHNRRDADRYREQQHCGSQRTPDQCLGGKTCGIERSHDGGRFASLKIFPSRIDK